MWLVRLMPKDNSLSQEKLNINLLPEMKISDPEVVSVLFHEKKQAILRLLMLGEKNIMDLKKELKMNPGTIKRHLDDLLAKNLVAKPRIIINKYGIKEKYYHAMAKRFIIHVEWP